MVNPYRGECTLVVDGEPRVMRLSLGALASLEEQLGEVSLMALVGRFEDGTFRAGDLVSLLTAGLNGGGWEVTQEALMAAKIDGGPVGAAKAAGQLLRVTFAVPGDDG